MKEAEEAYNSIKLMEGTSHRAAPYSITKISQHLFPQFTAYLLNPLEKQARVNYGRVDCDGCAVHARAIQFTEMIRL
jgi:hypothetical protein